MVLIGSGAAVLIATIIVFWRCLPRGGQTHRFVGTELEPYVGIAFCSAFALSFTMLLSGILEYMGN